MKRAFRFLFVTIIAALCLGGWTEAKAASTNEYTMKIQQEKDIKAQVHEIAEIARKLGFAEDHPIIVHASKEWHAADARQKEHSRKLNEWEKKEKEYPNACTVWNYLKNQGINDHVAAGIMGNLMAETGGQTLAINPYIWSDGYYGICQWSLYYCPEVGGCSLEGQLNYLMNSMPREFGNFGFCYYDGFGYNSFLNLMNEREAAVAFASVYERCYSGSYYVRQDNATYAYKYFVG